MKEQILQILSKNKQSGYNILREYLQHLILRELFELNVLEKTVFHGGTALHIIYEVNRFSEDLDFHLLDKNISLDMTSMVNDLLSRLSLQAYKVTAKNRTTGSVMSSFIKFEELLYEANISPHQSEKINIKIDIDKNPPAGFITDKTIVNKYFPFALNCHDPSTFLAGKMHAILQRAYTKGRDFYDLWFFLSRWKNIIPNIQYLNNALRQTGYSGLEINKENYKEVLRDRIQSLSWQDIVDDVEPFLENRNDLKAFKKDILLKMLEGPPNTKK